MITKFGVQNYSINLLDHGFTYVASQYGHNATNKHDL